jgi:hypothetical protein
MKAHLYLVKRAWVGLAPSIQASLNAYDEASPAARAIVALGRLMRDSPLRRSDGQVVYTGEITPKLLAMADIPDDAPWATYERGSKNYGAWRGFVCEVFAGKPIADCPQITAPWPWPPKADGAVYVPEQRKDYVPGTLCSPEDLRQTL